MKPYNSRPWSQPLQLAGDSAALCVVCAEPLTGDRELTEAELGRRSCACPICRQCVERHIQTQVLLRQVFVECPMIGAYLVCMRWPWVSVPACLCPLAFTLGSSLSYVLLLPGIRYVECPMIGAYLVCVRWLCVSYLRARVL